MTKHITLTEGHYYVVRPEDAPDKFGLIKAMKTTDTKIAGYLESKRKGVTVEKVTSNIKNVVADLGPNPPAGRVYGLDLTNRFRKRLEHPFWGNILVYTDLDKAQLKLVHNSLERTAKKIERMGLEPFVNLSDTHLVAKQGKWAGRYKHKGNDNEDIPHIIEYAPECADMSPKSMDYVVYHEFGHVVRYNGVVSKKLRLKWLIEFNHSIADFEITQAHLRQIYKAMEENVDADKTLGAVFREFLSEDEEHALWVRGLLRWFKEVHHLHPKELSILWDSRDMSHFKALWPTKAVDSSRLAPVVSEYATKNVEELFAEAFSYYCTGKKLPGRIETLLENSLQYAKAAGAKDD